MTRLKAKYDPAFSRDLKKLRRKHVDDGPLEEVIELILANTPASRAELIHRHGMHGLAGSWSGSLECHVCNAGDWLLIWAEVPGMAFFQRTGTHDDIFRRGGSGRTS